MNNLRELFKNIFRYNDLTVRSKNSEGSTPDTATETSENPTKSIADYLILEIEDQIFFNRLASERKLAIWRDEVTSRVSLHFYDKFQVFEGLIEQQISNSGFFEKRFSAEKIQNRIDNQFRKWVESEHSILQSYAQKDLMKIFDAEKRKTERSHNNSFKYMDDKSLSVARTDYLIGNAGTGIGAGLVLATPALATSSASGIAGLLGATIISGPVAFAGISIGLVTLIFGSKKSKKAEEKLKSNFKNWYRNIVFGSKSNAKSICEDIEDIFVSQYAQLLTDLKDNDR